MTTRRYLLSALVASAIATAGLSGARSHYVAIQQKFDSIENYRYKPGTRVPLSTQEVNEYVRVELPKHAPPGIRNPRVELHGNNTATGYALINFLKIRQAHGKPPNWLVKKLLDGERDVAVTTEVVSSGGTATVHLRKVEIEGIPIEGAALDFIVRNYLLPNYPTAKIGRPIRLSYGIDRLEVKPGRAEIVLRASRLK